MLFPRVIAVASVVVTAVVGAPRAAAQPEPDSVDAAFAASTAQAVARVVGQEYFDVDVASRVSAALVTDASSGRFASATSREALAALLTTDLYALTHDKHLAVAVRRPPATVPPGGSGVSAQRDRPTNAGFRRIDVLAGNVGYLDLTMFLRPAEHRDALALAMRTLEGASSLVLDMRDNGGGSPATVALLLSYLFDEPSLPLFEVVSRSGERETYATEPASARMDRNGSRPIWVLTSPHTFSGGEGTAFLLQERRRATVVGEQTAGAANPGRPYPVNDIFDVTVPNGQVRTAIKQANWEGTGVTPDVVVPATQALDVALDLARRNVRDGARRVAPPGR